MRRPADTVRTTVLLWSTASGVVLGLFVAVALVALGALAAAALPEHWRHSATPLMPAAALLTLLALPLAGGVLGYLEGRLKLH